MPWDKKKKGRTEWLLFEPTFAIWLETKKKKKKNAFFILCNFNIYIQLDK